MKDILLKDDNRTILCELDGLRLTYTYYDDPKHHYVVKLRDPYAFEALKRELDTICDHEDFDFACEFLQTVDCHRRYFVDDSAYVYCDIRDREEIEDYEEEAFDKVWLMRNCCISEKWPKNEVGRASMNRILSTYKDIPKDGYTDWECGYWNGILGALRWVLGDEKDFLDT